MRLFNAIQLVIFFALWPFLIAWLVTSTAAWAIPATVVAILAYAVVFIWMIAMVWHAFTDWEW